VAEIPFADYALSDHFQNATERQSMKIFSFTRLAVSASALLLAGTLQAQPPMAPPIQMFDRDGNGTVSEEEFLQGRAERMAKMAESGRPMRHAGRGLQFSDIDVNKDGEATLQEFIAARRAMMEQRRAERMAYPPAMRQPGAAMPGPAATMPGMGTGDVAHQAGGCMQKRQQQRMRGRHHGMHGKGKPRQSFEDIDLDGDGMISREEFEKHHANR
jgi:hypothetical protein